MLTPAMAQSLEDMLRHADPAMQEQALELLTTLPEDAWRVRLDHCTLPRAASLRGVCLDGASLWRLRASLLDLRGVSLAHAIMYGAVLDRPDLRGACLDDASLRFARITRARLDSASLQRLYLDGATLEDCDLRSLVPVLQQGAVTTFSRCDLRGVDFSGQRLDRLRIIDCQVEGASLSTRMMREAWALQVDLRGQDFQGADMQGVRLAGSDLSGCDLRSADLRGANLSGCTLHRTRLQGAFLKGTDLRGANLRQADLRGADLHRANLSNTRLDEANLSGARMRRAILRSVDVKDTQLTGADVSGAIFQHCQLQRARTVGLIYSPQTRWPSHYSPPRCARARFP